MRGRTKLVSLATMLAVLLTVSMVFASGFVDVSTVSLFSEPPVGPDSPGPNEVFIDPNKIIKDYLVDPGYQIGNTFVVHINVSSVTDLFSYQVNITWNTAMLNFTGIWAYGDFLARTGSAYGTSRIEDIYVASNATGYASIAETILGDVAGITGSGRLVTIEFQIVGYGWTDLFISSGGSLPTTLLDSAGATITWNHQASLFGNDGYFSNRLGGDVDSDRDVDYSDFIVLAGAYGSVVGQPAYKRNADFDQDGDVDYSDFIKLAGNYGKSVPP